MKYRELKSTPTWGLSPSPGNVYRRSWGGKPVSPGIGLLASGCDWKRGSATNFIEDNEGDQRGPMK